MIFYRAVEVFLVNQKVKYDLQETGAFSPCSLIQLLLLEMVLVAGVLWIEL